MSLDIIIGPMFAGKSSRVADIVSRFEALDGKVLVVKPSCDTRYGNGHITHNRRHTACISVKELDDIPKELIQTANVILVDEAQFFSHLVPFCEYIVDTLEKKLYLVGLDGDSNRRPFGEILNCIPLADRVERLTAFCKRCANGTAGLFSHRKAELNEVVVIGGNETYETLCRECYLRAFM
jgi:thymidine kinase